MKSKKFSTLQIGQKCKNDWGTMDEFFRPYYSNADEIQPSWAKAHIKRELQTTSEIEVLQ